MTQRILGVLLTLMMGFSSGAGRLAPHEDPTGTLLLVNKQHRAPSLRPELVLPDIPPSREEIRGNLYMRPDAAAAIEALFAAAKAEGHLLYGISGYRSYATQQSIYNRRVGESGDTAKKWVAPPGCSEHQTGLAMDITGQSVGTGLSSDFAESPEGIWVAANAHTYGFIIRYQKGWENITGYNYEPWHIRYVGIEDAAALYRENITLEEYLARLQNRRVAGFAKPEAEPVLDDTQVLDVTPSPVPEDMQVLDVTPAPTGVLVLDSEPIDLREE